MILVGLISMVPIIELRGAIPYAGITDVRSSNRTIVYNMYSGKYDTCTNYISVCQKSSYMGS